MTDWQIIAVAGVFFAKWVMLSVILHQRDRTRARDGSRDGRDGKRLDGAAATAWSAGRAHTAVLPPVFSGTHEE